MSRASAGRAKRLASERRGISKGKAFPRRGSETRKPSSGIDTIPQTYPSPAPESTRPAPWHDSRYMKAYRELRGRVGFLDLCKNPDLAAEVAVTAAARLGVDAAIIFADLLLIAEPLGFKLAYDRGEGPGIEPVLRRSADVDRLLEVDLESLGYLFEAIRRTRASLDARLPLLGFAGAPFTLASYLIEGGGSRHYQHTKAL